MHPHNGAECARDCYPHDGQHDHERSDEFDLPRPKERAHALRRAIGQPLQFEEQVDEHGKEKENRRHHLLGPEPVRRWLVAVA